MSKLSDAYKTLLVWHDDFKLTHDEVVERVFATLKCGLSRDNLNELQYWCVLFYGEPIFQPYPEDQPSLFWE